MDLVGFAASWSFPATVFIKSADVSQDISQIYEVLLQTLESSFPDQGHVLQ